MRSLFRHLFAYNIVSGVTLAVDLLIVYLLVELVGIYYLAAVVSGLLIAIIGGYALNRRFTYPETDVGWNAGCVRSLVVGVMVFCVIVGLTYVFVEYVSMQYLFARSVVAIIGGALSFLLDARFTYHVPMLGQAKGVRMREAKKL